MAISLAIAEKKLDAVLNGQIIYNIDRLKLKIIEIYKIIL